MPVIRTYKCNDCGDVFDVVMDSGDAPDADCPYCAKVMEWRPGMFAIKTNKSRAMDLTQKIVEEDYGLSDLKDNLREGDIAAKTPVRSRDEREALEKIEHDIKAETAGAQNMHPNTPKFFGGGGTTGQPMTIKTALANAKGMVPADRNPMEMLAKAGKKGELPMNYRLRTESGREITIRK